jgi:hypothetical protein
VIYNWVQNNVYGGEGGNYNIVNNYYKPGPSTNKSVLARIVNPLRTATIPFGKFYVDGNFVEGSADVTKNNSLGVVLSNGSEDDKRTALVSQHHQFAAVTTHAATEAYNLILQKAGASIKRDTLDERIINDVKNRTGRIIDVQGGYAHGTAYETSRNAWPSLRSLPASKDSDADGMPDEWETRNGLNANDASDASNTKLHKHYTNIEVYINGLVK